MLNNSKQVNGESIIARLYYKIISNICKRCLFQSREHFQTSRTEGRPVLMYFLHHNFERAGPSLNINLTAQFNSCWCCRLDLN